MERDYEEAVNLDEMTDRDIRELVEARLAQDEEFDADNVEVTVTNGRVRVEGRVGTEGERQYVGQVLTGLGAEDFDNDVVVDELRRAERSDAADIARLEDEASEAALGEAEERTSDTAEHRVDHENEDLYGTRDLKRAIEEGESYIPPTGPVQEGVLGDENH